MGIGVMVLEKVLENALMKLVTYMRVKFLKLLKTYLQGYLTKVKEMVKEKWFIEIIHIMKANGSMIKGVEKDL